MHNTTSYNIQTVKPHSLFLDPNAITTTGRTMDKFHYSSTGYYWTFLVFLCILETQALTTPIPTQLVKTCESRWNTTCDMIRCNATYDELPSCTGFANNDSIGCQAMITLLNINGWKMAHLLTNSTCQYNKSIIKTPRTTTQRMTQNTTSRLPNRKTNCTVEERLKNGCLLKKWLKNENRIFEEIEDTISLLLKFNPHCQPNDTNWEHLCEKEWKGEFNWNFLLLLLFLPPILAIPCTFLSRRRRYNDENNRKA